MANFDEMERFILADLDAPNREEAIKGIQGILELEEVEDEIGDVYRNLLNTLAAMSDDEYAQLDIEDYKREQKKLEYEIAYDEKLTELGILSEDGVVLRDITTEEKAMIEAELREMGFEE